MRRLKAEGTEVWPSDKLDVESHHSIVLDLMPPTQNLIYKYGKHWLQVVCHVWWDLLGFVQCHHPVNCVILYVEGPTFNESICSKYPCCLCTQACVHPHKHAHKHWHTHTHTHSDYEVLYDLLCWTVSRFSLIKAAFLHHLFISSPSGTIFWSSRIIAFC